MKIPVRKVEARFVEPMLLLPADSSVAVAPRGTRVRIHSPRGEDNGVERLADDPLIRSRPVPGRRIRRLPPLLWAAERSLPVRPAPPVPAVPYRFPSVAWTSPA